MAASKLYPTLSAFYKNTYIGFGSEANLAAGVDTHPCRKPLADDHKRIHDANVTEDKVERRIGGKIDEAKPKRRTTGLRPEASQRQKTVPLNDNVADGPSCLPSAPPMEWPDELIERFLEDTLTQQQLFSLENDLAFVDIPNIDYSTLRVPPNGSNDADVSWVDDLIPDYDTTPDETGTNKLNNLNKEATKEPQSSAILVKNIVETEGEPNSSRSNLPPSAEQTHQSQPCLRHRQHRHAVGAKREIIYRPRISRNQTSADHSGQSNAKVAQGPASQEKENRFSSAEDLSTSQRVHPSGSSPPPGSEEYSAWMTWRKQVNRQLATSILLRGNHQSPLQKTDRGLSQSSYDFISQFAKCGQNTPLGSKPFVMYGIPRVSLPNN